MTVTSEGVDIVRRPTLDDLRDLPVVEPKVGSIDSGPSSSDSIATGQSDTPGSTLASGDTDATYVSPTGEAYPFGTDLEQTEKEMVKAPERKPRPVISVQTFTPLIGSLLMSQSNVVCDSAKIAIIGILARLRGKDLPNYDPFPERHVEVGQSRTYFSQTGTHIHEISALTEAEKRVVENELVQAIVIGMARLDETQSPYEEEQAAEETRMGDEYATAEGDDTGMFEHYQWPDRDHDHASQPADEQLPPAPDQVVEQPHESSSGHLGSPPRLNESEPSSPGSIVLVLPTAADEEPVISVRSDPSDTSDPVNGSEPEPAVDVSASVEASSPDGGATYAQNALLEQSLHSTDDYDSPNAPPVDHRTDDEESAWAAQESQFTFGENQFRDELAVEASHGRLLSMNLIAAVLECGVLEGEEVISRQFVPEVVRMRFDESFQVRREACGAMAELLKVVSDEIVMESLLSLFDAFASDESPHVRQAACLALPALSKRLSPPAFRRSHALKTVDAFFADEFTEIHATALEVLGELIHVFHDDPDGPPDALIRHFLGPPLSERKPVVVEPQTLNVFATGPPIITGGEDTRPLVCAFNVSRVSSRTYPSL